MISQYTTTHNNWDPHLVFPFVVAKFKLDKIYIDPMWGLRIQKLTVDGVVIRPEPFKAKFDDVNFNKIEIGDAPFVYVVRRHSLRFASAFDEKGEFQLQKYTIPETAIKIVFDYRLRESPDSVGPDMSLLSRLA
jgi:hypothetical protein